MTAPSKSVYYFGIYLILVGISLVVVPNFVLSLLFLPATSEVWIRIVGVLVFNIGVLYYVMAPENNRMFMILTVYLRASVFVWFVLFVVIGWAPAMLIGFGVVDLLGAIWTYSALKK
jgi:hypothetical protein